MFDINWKIKFLPTYWQDHPEVKTNERSAYATGFSLDLAGNMGLTYAIGTASIIALALAFAAEFAPMFLI
ncbi:hypothetical protein QP862_12900 [Lacticaseibacillus rhamnosus]|uniref:hypothetical protein n=1 Tax=Lacticaseibacillus rhamnosus TaxID=47715 RepID=UPI000532D2D5|nr:hypothetical protein [Lacticaseibacillus rhamnosus]MCT3169190.1 hypothetical protein [Lacticaseibacillus rhamnosus]MCT3177994.1 hypothetical protein [Lacticaseibacillus rhamnosus]MCT3184627.1 hypothetical protein [Lacticaseibacillus rhamnosus]MCT4448210.1 hypothetical protein [Lacticaseibacillus rhamnosus]MDK8384223.1 hypothetical protein [Lacticaseibacillus rhamnosus]